MNHMYFKGTIIKAGFHPGDAKTIPTIQLRIIIDVVEEIMVEEQGTISELADKFKLNQHESADWVGLITGRRCTILRNASGYHFISMI